jgi:hypothetical protein
MIAGIIIINHEILPSPDYLLGLIIALAILGLLIYALVKPEKF